MILYMSDKYIKLYYINNQQSNTKYYNENKDENSTQHKMKQWKIKQPKWSIKHKSCYNQQSWTVDISFSIVRSLDKIKVYKGCDRMKFSCLLIK